MRKRPPCRPLSTPIHPQPRGTRQGRCKWLRLRSRHRPHHPRSSFPPTRQGWRFPPWSLRQPPPHFRWSDSGPRRPPERPPTGQSTLTLCRKSRTRHHPSCRRDPQRFGQSRPRNECPSISGSVRLPSPPGPPSPTRRARPLAPATWPCPHRSHRSVDNSRIAPASKIRQPTSETLGSSTDRRRRRCRRPGSSRSPSRTRSNWPSK